MIAENSTIQGRRSDDGGNSSSSSSSSVGPYKLQISWESIIHEFGIRYDLVFQHKSAKAHLDMTNQIIDGAKGKWKYIMLMDCLLCFTLGNERSIRECGRRRFNQYSVLRESVCLAVSSAWLYHLQSAGETESGVQSAEFPSMIDLTNVEYPWNSCTLLYEFLSNPRNAPKKSFRKRLEILNVYFSNSIFESISLNELISHSIRSIYCQHFRVGLMNPKIVIPSMVAAFAAASAHTTNTIQTTEKDFFTSKEISYDFYEDDNMMQTTMADKSVDQLVSTVLLNSNSSADVGPIATTTSLFPSDRTR